MIRDSVTAHVQSHLKPLADAMEDGRQVTATVSTYPARRSIFRRKASR